MESMAEQLLEKIEHYWTGRAAGYSKVNQEELAGKQRKDWLAAIEQEIEKVCGKREKKNIRILDAGTGPGFFAIILAEAGYCVTAVDYTPAMLDQARKNAGPLEERIDFRQMDAQELQFEEESFDVVISRNLTWVLEHPDRAYASWKRVLKKNGLLINFDANWYHYLYDEKKEAAYQKDREAVREQGMEDYNTAPDIDEDAMEEIARAVPLGREDRPAWDIRALEKIRMQRIQADTEVWKRVWTPVEQVNFASTPLFMVTAQKD